MTYEIQKEDEQYPKRLLTLTDAPEKLFVQGSIPHGKYVSIVGTRKANPSMLNFTRTLAEHMTRSGIVVVSGGALGIDTAAHEGALEGGGTTISVLGSGLDCLYPRKNKKLFKEIVKKDGAVISEFPGHTPPTRWTFPRRNRLVAALAHLVVVVEAPIKSGSMITARIAKRIHVPIGAVPGRPTDEFSKGCNHLIRHGAHLIEGPEDVLKIVGGDKKCHQLDLLPKVKQVMESSSNVPMGLSGDEQKVWSQLSLDSMHIDDIATGTKLPIQAVNSAVLSLELSGLIEDLGGRRFVRTQL